MMQIVKEASALGWKTFEGIPIALQKKHSKTMRALWNGPMLPGCVRNKKNLKSSASFPRTRSQGDIYTQNTNSLSARVVAANTFEKIKI
jgi:hypothetical protein